MTCCSSMSTQNKWADRKLLTDHPNLFWCISSTEPCNPQGSPTDFTRQSSAYVFCPTIQIWKLSKEGNPERLRGSVRNILPWCSSLLPFIPACMYFQLLFWFGQQSRWALRLKCVLHLRRLTHALLLVCVDSPTLLLLHLFSAWSASNCLTPPPPLALFLSSLITLAHHVRDAPFCLPSH